MRTVRTGTTRTVRRLLVAAGLGLALGPGCSPCWRLCHKAMPYLHVRWAVCDATIPPPTSYVQPPRCACTFSTTLTGPTETVHLHEDTCQTPHEPFDGGSP